MKKSLPFVVLCLLALGLGFMVWWMVREPHTDPVTNTEPEMKNRDFQVADFVPTFDLNNDKRVTYDEFLQSYGKSPIEGEPPLVFHEENGGPALSPEEAFKRWDHDKSGIVDVLDIKFIEDKAWANFQAEAEKRGLRAREWDGVRLMLNTLQDGTYVVEVAAAKVGELPFAGRYWKADYLGDWVRVITPDNRTLEGYASHSRDKLFLLTSDAKLSVFDEAKVTVKDLGPDTPQAQYAATIRNIALKDASANLELAKKCREWGMRTEAGMLFARVLVFDRANQEALDALGYKLDGDNYIQKGN